MRGICKAIPISNLIKWHPHASFNACNLIMWMIPCSTKKQKWKQKIPQGLEIFVFLYARDCFC